MMNNTADSDSDDELIRQIVMLDNEDMDEPTRTRPRHGGSRCGKSMNKPRDAFGRHKQLVIQYFANNLEWVADANQLCRPVYTKEDFRQQYRMSRRLFNKVCAGVTAANPAYFEQRSDACGKMDISLLV